MRWILASAAILGATSIVMGAAFKHMSGVDSEIIQTALRYHQIHSVALLSVGLYALDKRHNVRIAVSAGLFIAGTVIFSGSLYAMAVFDISAFGKLTPIGGIVFILAWLSLIFIKRVMPDDQSSQA